mmetsp:Transcript_18499/g.30281  ORF Transcript_18499/g.30281 Transcript_18499/m.30281 type:complete len:85 (-) Transcript_18499:293-547(-)
MGASGRSPHLFYQQTIQNFHNEYYYMHRYTHRIAFFHSMIDTSAAQLVAKYSSIRDNLHSISAVRFTPFYAERGVQFGNLDCNT